MKKKKILQCLCIEKNDLIKFKVLLYVVVYTWFIYLNCMVCGVNV